MNDEHVFDLVPAYALGSLDPDEKNRVESHLAQCLVCKAELASYQAVVTSLASTPAQINPPRRLKESIVNAARQQQSLGTNQRAPAMPLRQRAHRPMDWQAWVRTLLPVWGIASLVLILALGVTNVLLWQKVQTASQPGKVVLSDFQIVSMVGTNAAPNATGIFLISHDGMAGSLTVDGLPLLNPAHQYQLWLTFQGKRTSGGVFSVDQGGYGSIKVNSSRPLIQYTSFGITIEPLGGSPGPTGDKVLGGNF